MEAEREMGSAVADAELLDHPALSGAHIQPWLQPFCNHMRINVLLVGSSGYHRVLQSIARDLLDLRTGASGSIAKPPP